MLPQHGLRHHTTSARNFVEINRPYSKFLFSVFRTTFSDYNALKLVLLTRTAVGGRVHSSGEAPEIASIRDFGSLRARG